MTPGTTSVLLFAVGVILLAAEAHLAGGILGVIGVSTIAGAVVALLVPSHYWVAFAVAFAAMGALSTAFFMTVYRTWRRSVQGREVMSVSSLINQQGVVVKTVDSHSMGGKVSIGGDVWTAQSSETLEPGTPVIVVKTEGVRAIVRRKADWWTPEV